MKRELFGHAAEEGDWSEAAHLGIEELVFNRQGDNSALDLAYELCPAGAELETVQAHGYAKQDYWREAMQGGYWTSDGFKGRWDDAWRQQPYDYGEPCRLSNHPVVGVSWNEAMAYTRWLTEEGRAWLPAGWRVQWPNAPQCCQSAHG